MKKAPSNEGAFSLLGNGFIGKKIFLINEKMYKNINFDESYDLIASAEDSDEADFFRMATDLVLKQKQRKAVEENRF